MSIKNWIEENAAFSKKTRKGITAFIVIFIVLIGTQNAYNYYVKPVSPQLELSERETNFVEQASAQNIKRIKYKKYKKKKRRYTIPTKPFNPNDYSAQDWQYIGLSEKQASAIINYQEKGFEFRVKNDVAKLFVVSDQLYQQLYPMIALPDSIVYEKQEVFVTENNKFEKKATKLIDVNKANQEEFKSLYGIGEKLSGRIIKYRNSLGGFYTVEQLKEVWGLTPEIFHSISQKLTLDSVEIQKININSAIEEKLKSHPYLDWKRASHIVKYRDNHGPFKSVEGIKELVLIDNELYNKIAPYITVK